MLANSSRTKVDFTPHPKAAINYNIPRFLINPENWGPGKMAGSGMKRFRVL